MDRRIYDRIRVVNSVYIILASPSKFIGFIAPSMMERFLFGITKSTSILYLIPNPLQSGHDP